ncbi:hypothetical protein PFAG_04621 [Plasmodium falciparum Santa Lucia]|uniref:J domain-containing protein n=1 Tax=Plasmodium falciparum Santa Lucia TaxID=478859 RepID=W7FR47_PLAFA|nr:hypothetical protein PFAG_04621 [Plasmodium falciparum Santa Lucia]
MFFKEYNCELNSSDEDILDDQNYIIQKKKNMKKNYYEILYVKQDFDINEIKRKFYNLSLKYYLR